jgi:kynureninase
MNAKLEFSPQLNSLEAARKLDLNDELHSFRSHFHLPAEKNGRAPLYFAGHSLGLMPKKARQYIETELEDWSRLGVEGHFHAHHPWLPYHEEVTDSLSRLVGAKPSEVVAMNTLTVNLHLMMVSFYRPTQKRYKILIEKNTFPSDKYAVDSQARFHGFNPKDAVVELQSEGMTLSSDEVLAQIRQHGDSLALVMLGNCNYLSGQHFDIGAITEEAHRVGALCGFNLAHGAGNLRLNLHESQADFAVWCSYKYLNSGPGAIAGAFVHERHHRGQISRFEGWWGHDKGTRFKMGPDFQPIPTVEAWQLSNPPIFQLASLRAALELFDSATMSRLRQKGDQITSYLEGLLRLNLGPAAEIVTPVQRGSMLCVRVPGQNRSLMARLEERNIFIDFREPDIFRMTPIPLYNSYEDCFALVQALKEEFSSAQRST